MTAPTTPNPISSAPVRFAGAITPHDSTPLPSPAYVYCGLGGDISVVLNGGKNTVVFQSTNAGAVLPVLVDRVNATGTTATGLVAMYP